MDISMYDKENKALVEKVRNRLLEDARDLCRIPEKELKRLIRIHRRQRRKCLDQIDWFFKNRIHILTIQIYLYRSELYRRRTGKHWFNMSSNVMQHHEVYKTFYLSDLVPHVVEEGAISDVEYPVSARVWEL